MPELKLAVSQKKAREIADKVARNFITAPDTNDAIDTFIIEAVLGEKKLDYPYSWNDYSHDRAKKQRVYQDQLRRKRRIDNRFHYEVSLLVAQGVVRMLKRRLDQKAARAERARLRRRAA